MRATLLVELLHSSEVRNAGGLCVSTECGAKAIEKLKKKNKENQKKNVLSALKLTCTMRALFGCSIVEQVELLCALVFLYTRVFLFGVPLSEERLPCTFVAREASSDASSLLKMSKHSAAQHDLLGGMHVMN